MIETKYIIILVFILLFILVLLLTLPVKSKNKKENFCNCNCQGMNTKVCINKDEVHRLYDSGELTENSKLVRCNQDLQYNE
jgi:hypothetical protein